jgi:hypothetical protein
LSKTLLDNIRIYKIPHLPAFYLESANAPLPPQSMSVKASSPVQYNVQVKGLSTARTIVLSESFNTKWVASIRSTGTKNKLWQVPEKYHLAVNGFANAWVIDPSQMPTSLRNANGNYEILLNYTPQKWLHIGIALSVVCVVGGLGLLLMRGLSNKGGGNSGLSSKDEPAPPLEPRNPSRQPIPNGRPRRTVRLG